MNSRNLVRMMKSMHIDWAEHVARMDKMFYLQAHETFTENAEERRLGKRTCR